MQSKSQTTSTIFLQIVGNYNKTLRMKNSYITSRLLHYNIFLSLAPFTSVLLFMKSVLPTPYNEYLTTNEFTAGLADLNQL